MAIYKLEDIAIIKNGTTPSTKNKNLWLKEIPFFGPSDLNNMKPKRYITKNINNLKRPGTTLISSTATIGNIGFLKIESWFNQQITSIEPNNNFLLDKYLYYYFLKNSKKIKNMKDGGSIFTILKISVFKNWKFFLPSLKTQKQIIDIIEPIEKLELTIKKLSKVIGFITKNTFITFSEKNDYNFQKGLLPIKNKVGITPFLNVSAANNKINRYVINEPNIKIGDVTISLDGNTGLVNNALEGFNGYLFKVTSKKWKNYQIYYSLKNKINQKIIKLNEIGTTIKHSSKSKKEILHLEFLEDFLLKEMFNLEISIFKIVKKLKKLKKFLINLLIN